MDSPSYPHCEPGRGYAENVVDHITTDAATDPRSPGVVERN